MKINIKSSVEFAAIIQEMVANSGITHLDAITDYCEQTGLEPEVAATLVKKNPTLKALVQNEAEELKLISKRKGGKLPV